MSWEIHANGVPGNTRLCDLKSNNNRVNGLNHWCNVVEGPQPRRSCYYAEVKEPRPRNGPWKTWLEVVMIDYKGMGLAPRDVLELDCHA